MNGQLLKLNLLRTIVGFQYRIVVEAVVSVKTAIESIDGDEEKNRRTTHIPSMPLMVRARAPVQPPVVLVTGMCQRLIFIHLSTVCS